MKTITLNLKERIRLADIIGSQEVPSVAMQREFLRLHEAVELSEAEAKEVGLTVDAVRGYVAWERDDGRTYSIELSDSQAAILAAVLNNEGGRFKLALRLREDAWALRVLEQLA